MLKSCFKLKELNLSPFDINNETNISDMFDSINKKCKIKCKNQRILDNFYNSIDCVII